MAINEFPIPTRIVNLNALDQSVADAATSAAASEAARDAAAASATAADADATATAADRVQTGLDRVATAADVVAAAGSETSAAASAVLADARADDAASFAGYRDYQDVATLLANTSLTYSAGSLQVAAGDVIRTRAEGFSYEVAAAAATDEHVTTAGGVKLYRIRDDLQGDFLPDADGAGTPSTALASMPVGLSFTVAETGIIGVGSAAGTLLYAGDVVTLESGSEPLLIVMSGQSNAQGVSEDGLGGTYRVDPDVRVWNNTAGEFQVADLENNAYFTTTGNPFGNGNQNIGVSFAHRLKAQSGRPVYVIVAAQGGQPISQWIGSGTASTIYAGMEAVIEAALASLGKASIDFFLWHQGEADAGSSQGTYRTLLATLVQQLRNEPWFDGDTPFIAGEACPEWTVTANRDRMNVEINTLLLTNDPHVFVAQTAGLVGDGGANNVHFSNASIDELGYDRYWRAMWRSSSNIPVTTAATATTSISVDDALYESRAFARESYVRQRDVDVRKNNGAVTVRSVQGSLVLSAKDGFDNVISNGLSLRPQLHGAQTLGLATRAWSNLYLTSSIVQPNIGGIMSFYVGIPGTGQERLRLAASGNFSRASVFAIQDIEGDGFSSLNFQDAGATARGEVTTTISGLSGAMRFGVRNTAGTMQYAMRIDNDGGVRFPLAYNLTTGDAANVTMFSNGEIFRSTSSRRYKENITPYEKGLAEVNQMQPVTYTGTGKADGDTVYAGLIAEDLDALGLSEFVTYDADGRPDAIRYPQLTALLVKAVQELTARLEALEAK